MSLHFLFRISKLPWRMMQQEEGKKKSRAEHMACRFHLHIRVSLISGIWKGRTVNPQSISLGQYYHVPTKVGPLATCLTLPVLEKSFSFKHCQKWKSYLKCFFDCNNRSARHLWRNYQKLEKKNFFFFWKFILVV